MFDLDDKFLEEVGLRGLPAEERPVLLRFIRQTLEGRLGETLSKGLPDGLLLEFLSYIQANRRDQAFKWLHQHAPGYPQVAQAEMARLKAEIKAAAPAILKHANETKAVDKSH